MTNATAPIILLSVIEAGIKLGVSKHTVYAWAKAGLLPTVQLGATRSMLRVRYADCVTFAERRASAPPLR